MFNRSTLLVAVVFPLVIFNFLLCTLSKFLVLLLFAVLVLLRLDGCAVLALDQLLVVLTERWQLGLGHGRDRVSAELRLEKEEQPLQPFLGRQLGVDVAHRQRKAVIMVVVMAVAVLARGFWE